MRIVSLAPNITQIIKYLDYESLIVGHTEHTSVENSAVVGGWLTPDYDVISELNPDVVFTSDALQREIRDDLDDKFNVYHTEPSSIDDLVPLMESVGSELDIDTTEKTEEIENRLESVRQYVKNNVNNIPTVYCEEWNDPPMVAGNWVPDAVKIAGGSYPFLETGDRSREISKEEFESEKPSYFISHICGYGVEIDVKDIKGREWALPDKIYIFHDDLLNQLSPKIVEGVEYLCHILHGYPMPDTSSVQETDPIS